VILRAGGGEATTANIVEVAARLPGGRPRSLPPAAALPGPGHLAVTASLVPVDAGLYALDIGDIGCIPSRLSSLPLPALQVSAPTAGHSQCVEIIGSGNAERWLGPEGGTVILKAPPGGGIVLLTAYSHPSQPAAVPTIEIRRLDRPRPAGTPLHAVGPAADPQEIQTEIVAHIERLGDRRFAGREWVGNRGKKLRIEAFSIRPLDTLLPGDIEFKALGPNRRQTPWVSDGKLCGTRSQRLPLTGFAVRLAGRAAERFDVIYEGAFFESGIVGPNRNGELCIPPIAEDPLEAIKLRVIRRPAR
jgi:hypothetical protein